MQILFHDDFFLAINKPANVLVHKTRISEDKTAVLQMLRDELGAWVYPVHRLDRGTSGVLIFGKSTEAANALSEGWHAITTRKRYMAVVRGFIAESGSLDYPLLDQETRKTPQPAVTHWLKLAEAILDAPIGLRYPQARYSLVEALPQTGRRHQIRKHFAHLRHPVLGDKRHGDNKHNMYWQEHFQLQRMLLHAAHLHFQHPFTKEMIHLTASIDSPFAEVLLRLDMLGAASKMLGL